ncbi:FCD domain-containing protein [Pseudonocardia nematodicida]|uniref:FCD domain-containing protein n=1 Tax=Pseudonocardia nematodicida TaxID=1206997 RepID=A0ABV1KGA2_9PSEU
MSWDRPVVESGARRVSRPAHIADHLYEQIMSGGFRPGALLPGQRELASQFDVSMATVRSAIGSLAAAGLIEVLPGKGSIVRSVGTGTPQFEAWLGTADSAQEMLDLLEARLVIERHHIEKATATAGPADLDRLRRACDDLAAAADDPVAFEVADYAFHLMLAEVADNSVTVRVLRAISEPMRRTLRLTNHGYIAQNGDLASSVAPHREMVEFIATGDVQAAVGKLEGMIERSQATVRLTL